MKSLDIILVSLSVTFHRYKVYSFIFVFRGVYELDVMSRGPDRGFYRLVVSVDAPDARLVGHTAAQLTFKVLTAIDIQGVEIGTADSDQSTPPNLKKLVS